MQLKLSEILLDQVSKEGMSYIVGGVGQNDGLTVINTNGKCDATNSDANCAVSNNGNSCSVVNNGAECKGK
ncbi:MAG: hypothetical protein K1W02_05495 [Muribaculaceae bacterium]|nr:hypothetical protein 54E5_00007 [uncultured bacterium]